MEQESPQPKRTDGLIYGLEDRPPFKEAFFASLQHLLAIFVAIITPPLIIAGFLVLLGLFPAVGLVFSLMPEPVLGGATLLMFGTVAAAGIRIIASQPINRKATLVIAISLSLGLSVELVPDILCRLPETLRNIFSSGITTGGLTAILTNVLIHIKEEN